ESPPKRESASSRSRSAAGAPSPARKWPGRLGPTAARFGQTKRSGVELSAHGFMGAAQWRAPRASVRRMPRPPSLATPKAGGEGVFFRPRRLAFGPLGGALAMTLALALSPAETSAA